MSAVAEVVSQLAELWRPADGARLWNDLARHVSVIDPAALVHWRQLSFSQRRKFVHAVRAVDGVAHLRRKPLIEQHRLAHDTLKRFFVSVQQKTFEYSYLNPGWLDFLEDSYAQKQLLVKALSILESAGIAIGRPGIVSLYGNIKPRESLNIKLDGLADFYRGEERGFKVWDCVRMRVVTEDVVSARDVAASLWQIFFDQIACCRNYWFAPKNCYVDSPYRAIHFLIAFEPGRVVEVQVVSLAREAASLLDHKLLFKASASFPSATHERWLRDFVYKVNVFDATQLGGGDAGRSGWHTRWDAAARRVT